MIQGDIISPIFFILAIYQIFSGHDDCPTGVKVDNYLNVGLIGHVDDVAITSSDKLTVRPKKSLRAQEGRTRT